jgi:hypothetical protein
MANNKKAEAKIHLCARLSANCIRTLCQGAFSLRNFVSRAAKMRRITCLAMLLALALEAFHDYINGALPPETPKHYFAYSLPEAKIQLRAYFKNSL